MAALSRRVLQILNKRDKLHQNQFVFFDIFALSLLSVNSSIIQQRWANSVFKPNFLTNAEKRAFIMKRTKRLRRMVDHDHYDHDDLMISMLCDGAT